MIRNWRSTVSAILLAFAIGIVPFTIDSAHADFPPGTSAYWALDDAQQAAPGEFVEEIDGINGVCAGGGCPTALAVGQVNGAQTFDGAATGIDVPDNAAFDWAADASFSIAVWVKRVDLAGGDLTGFAEIAIGRDEQVANVASGVYWWLGISNNGSGNPKNVATFVLSDAGAVNQFNSDFALLGTADIADGNWHYLVGVRDYVNELILLYVDGVEVASKTVAQAGYANGFNSARPMTVGYLDYRSGVSPSFWFEGDIDEVALFNTALTATEITQYYDLGFGPPGVSLRAAVVPVANDDSYITPLETALIELAPGVLVNDTPGTTATKVTEPANGTLTAFNTDGSFTYTPNAGFTGNDTFTYKVTDSTGTDSLDATVTIGVNVPVVAADDTYTTEEDTVLDVAAPGVLANDTPAGVTAIKVTDPASGTLTLNSDGSFSYTPDAGFTGTDAFTYTATDGVSESTPATATITVTAAPVTPPVITSGGGGGGGGCFIMTAGK